MTLKRRESRSGQERTSAFVEQTAAEETAQLHCEIPASLHRRLRILAVEENTTMKHLVLSAVEQFLAAKGWAA